MDAMRQSVATESTHPPMISLKHVTVVQNVTTDPKGVYAGPVVAFFEQHGMGVLTIPVETKDMPVVPVDAPNPDLVVVLGGDGTFLRAAQVFNHHQVPMVGINTGRLGFLTRIEANNVQGYLEKLMAGQYTIEETMTLSVMRTGPTLAKADSDPTAQISQLAINDVVVKNANPSQMCTLNLYINETLVATYDADGLIVSTPMGTTAYNLSAGGPVLSPEVEAMTITPICPHSFSAKSVVVPANKTVRIQSDSKNQHVVVALDGQDYGHATNGAYEDACLLPGESLQVFKSPLSLRVVNFEEYEDNFYIILKKKLDWSMNPRHRTP
ncbi:MAG: NAD(+)/NADH kinase [Candidatus Melainabacteria bacterium]